MSGGRVSLLLGPKRFCQKRALETTRPGSPAPPSPAGGLGGRGQQGTPPWPAVTAGSPLTSWEPTWDGAALGLGPRPARVGTSHMRAPPGREQPLGSGLSSSSSSSSGKRSELPAPSARCARQSANASWLGPPCILSCQKCVGITVRRGREGAGQASPRSDLELALPGRAACPALTLSPRGPPPSPAGAHQF